jgi:hypothetical protein
MSTTSGSPYYANQSAYRGAPSETARLVDPLPSYAASTASYGNLNGEYYYAAPPPKPCVLFVCACVCARAMP